MKHDSCDSEEKDFAESEKRKYPPLPILLYNGPILTCPRKLLVHLSSADENELFYIM